VSEARPDVAARLQDPEFLRKIDALASAYPQPRTALLMCLHLCQSEVRHIPGSFQEFIALDKEELRLPNVRDLLEALNRLKVPFKDRVSILEEIHRAGKLHAKLMYEG